MSATAAPVRQDGPAWGEAGFRRRVRELESFHAALWLSTDDGPPTLGARVTKQRQKENLAEAERLLEDVARRCEAYPDSERARRSWRAQVREVVRQFGEDRLGWPEGYRSLLLSEAFYDTTVEFVRTARVFDPGVRMEEVTQALRNVWIMNSIQLLLDREISFSPAIFGYSMLYPVTDNFLDRPGVSPRAKADFNARFERRLEGERLFPRTARERQAFHLVERIETRHSRDRSPGVFQSLLAIHRAQQSSLIQQRSAPAAGRVLAISVAKGGASVLADGYLVCGHLSPDEEKLCFGYGVFLQLLDDLQDVRDDGQAGHTTLFTIAANEGTLDRVTGRLHAFMHRTMSRSPRIAGPTHADRRDLIVRNCTSLLVGSVARHRPLFGRSFLRDVEERWPFALSAMSRLQRTAGRRFRRAGRELTRRTGARSPLDLL